MNVIVHRTAAIPAASFYKGKLHGDVKEPLIDLDSGIVV